MLNANIPAKATKNVNKNQNIEMPFHRTLDFSIELMVTHTPLQNMAKANLYILQHA